MRLLQVHNRYQNRGGEDTVAEAEADLLKSHGITVDLLEADNTEIVGLAAKTRTALGTIYSPAAKARMAARIATSRPDVVHVHNFFPLFSPSIYYGCSEAGVPVVQTLHNYRLICPGGLLFRDGHACEDCVGGAFAWSGVLHGCYRGSRLGTASIAAMSSIHTLLRTWRDCVSCFIALGEFAKAKFVEGGLPERNIVVKPNFARDSSCVSDGRGQFAFFAGRLSPEKGITTLLSAWECLDGSSPCLKVAGDGPMKSEVAQHAARGFMEYIGVLPHENIQELMRQAAFLVFPSVCYENFPLAIVEAFACGVPVIASRTGAMAEIIADGRTGLHFTPGDARDLAAKVEWACAHRREMGEMGRAGRAEYLAKYTPERNYQMLMEIYERVIHQKKGH